MGRATQIQASAVSRFFSATLIRQLAKGGFSPMFARLLIESGINQHLQQTDTVGSVFEIAFSFLKQKSYRHEYAYKAAITHKVLMGIHSLNTASMINEFRVKDCKADVVILNGTGSAYEIKSERDSLSRLQKQVSAYRTVFATVNVIVGENHLEEVLELVHSDVGVMVLRDRYHIGTIRAPIDDPGRTNSIDIFESITIKEAELILRNVGKEIPTVPNTKRFTVYKTLFSKIPSEIAHMQMVTVLKQTRKLSSLAPYVEKLPVALHSAALSLKLNKGEFSQLVDVMSIPVEQSRDWANSDVFSILQR